MKCHFLVQILSLYLFIQSTEKKKEFEEGKPIKAYNKKIEPVRPPAPVTSTVLLEDSAMATTLVLIPTLLRPSLWFASDSEEEEE